MKKYYNFSEDYNKLFDLICQGFTIVGFCYDFLHETKDVLQIKRTGEYSIRFSVRGLEYHGIYPSDKDLIPNCTERQLFVSACIKINLKWIEK